MKWKLILTSILLLAPTIAACKDWSCLTGFPTNCSDGYYMYGTDKTGYYCRAVNDTTVNSTSWNKTNGFVILAHTPDFVGVGSESPIRKFVVEGNASIDDFLELTEPGETDPYPLAGRYCRNWLYR